MISLDIWVMVMIGFHRPEWKSLDNWKGMGKLVKTSSQHSHVCDNAYLACLELLQDAVALVLVRLTRHKGASGERSRQSLSLSQCMTEHKDMIPSCVHQTTYDADKVGVHTYIAEAALYALHIIVHASRVTLEISPCIDEGTNQRS